MTATHSAPFGFPHTLFAFLRRMRNLFAKGVLAIAIVFMAGVIGRSRPQLRVLRSRRSLWSCVFQAQVQRSVARIMKKALRTARWRSKRKRPRAVGPSN